MAYNPLGPGHGQDEYYMDSHHGGRSPSPDAGRGYQLEDVHPGYQLEDAHPAYQLDDPHPGYHLEDPQPGYHLEDAHPAYMQHATPSPGPLEIPMGPGPQPRMHSPGDVLAPQPTYSLDDIHDNYAHNDPFDQAAGDAGMYPQEYAINPNDHHDAYFQSPYQPTPQESLAIPDYPMENEAGYYNEHEDSRPILSGDPYGPDVSNNGYDPSVYPAPSPVQPIKRWKTVKEVQLFEGNLVLDCPIPPVLLDKIPHAPPPERDEFTHMRYTAATCDPADFFEDRFTLRQKLFAKPRHTELFIVITMYNEDDVLFGRTLSGVLKNVEHMCSRKDSKTWGPDAWKKIVVCVVSDGRAKINPRTKAVLSAMGIYQDGIAKQQVNGKDVTAHIYEYTTQTSLSVKHDKVTLKHRQQPVQMLFCLKEKNSKKINSHRWFFQAFGRVLDPNVCVLIDAGTRPGKDSIYQLWKAFDLEPNCAGACGEIKAMLGTGGKHLLNPLVATQNFEYKMSNILDKPMESSFGFISVLPGAFSAYRYIALQNDALGQGPLEKYFAGEKMHGANAGIFTANMYLAEDRILCFELVSKRKCHWILQYVKSATGETDVPDTMAEMILQRRRWLNGSFFAAIYSITHFYQLFRSNHSVIRTIAFLIEFIYQTISMVFAWFAIGNFYLVFRILTTSLGGDELLGNAGNILATVFQWLYAATLLSCFVLAMGNRPQGSNAFYMTMVLFWVGIMIYLMFASIFITVKSVQHEVGQKGFTFSDLFNNEIFFTLIVSLASTYFLWFIVSFIFLDPWHIFTSFAQYIALTPTYINILNVYAFCNTHDITWGTKGDDTAEALPSAKVKADGKVDVAIPTDDADLNQQYMSELAMFAHKAPPEKREIKPAEKQEDYYKGFRSAVVLVWMACNIALVAVVLSTSGKQKLSASESMESNNKAKIYMSVILWSVAGLSAFRFMGAMWFLVVRMFRGV